MLLGKDFVMQGGVRNYLGKTQEVTAPKYWKSSKNSPETELAYITEAEKNLLLDANLHGSLKNGQPNVGASGLLSYDGWGDVSGGVSDTSASNAGAEGGQGSGSSGNTGYQAGGDNRREQYSVARTTTPVSQPVSLPSNAGNDSPYIMSGGERFAVDDPRVPEMSNEVDQRNILQKGVDNVLDFVKSGGILGNVLGGISSFSEGLQEKAISFSLNKKLSDIYEANPDFEDYESLDEIPGEIGAKVRDLESDLQGLRDGTFKQSDYTAKYGSGDVTNPLDASFNPNLLSDRDERNLQNLFTSDFAYALSGTRPQDSMVNQYFANMGMSNQPLSSNLQTDYNNAKNSINSILGVLPPSQQFGYSADPYGGLMASNLTTNPFNIDYLRRLGLI